MDIFLKLVRILAGCFFLACIGLAIPVAAQEEEFPQRNAWYQATPSVVWCGDAQSTTTLEVHIVGREDVARVWMTDLGTSEEEGRGELFDDGTHGDQIAGDNIFTLSDVVLPCRVSNFMFHGWANWLGFLRVELVDGRATGNNYGLLVGTVDPKYKDAFEVVELGPGLTATAYSFFIEDTAHEVIDDYPVATVYCGTSNFVAFQKLYSVFPDVFDFAALMPGMVIFRPQDLAENVPYNVLVKNEVQHIGIDIFDNTAAFGSAGKLKSVTYQSFGTIAIFDHEIAHTWGAAIGQNLGLLGDQYTWDVNQGHWNPNADMEGQLGNYYFDNSGAVGHFGYNGDEIWRLIPNYVAEPYSPLELYVMGLIPPEEVPPIHILSSPDTANTEMIKPASYRTVTIEEIMASEGGPRVPSHVDSPKDFSMAFIVTQDRPYDDAAYAFFSLISYQLTSRQPVSEYETSLAPFYWATGGRATLETRLPLELEVPHLPEMPEEAAPAEGSGQEMTETPPVVEEDANSETAADAVEGRAEEGDAAAQPGGFTICPSLPLGILLLPLGAAWKKRRKRH